MQMQPRELKRPRCKTIHGLQIAYISATAELQPLSSTDYACHTKYYILYASDVYNLENSSALVDSHPESVAQQDLKSFTVRYRRVFLLYV